MWSIRALSAAGEADVLAELDAEWDSAKRSLHLGLAVAEEAKEAIVRVAATRLRETLLSGGGPQHTLLSYEQEVDFARDQATKAQQVNVTADIGRVCNPGPDQCATDRCISENSPDKRVWTYGQNQLCLGSFT